jgi:hypothetical protein
VRLEVGHEHTATHTDELIRIMALAAAKHEAQIRSAVPDLTLKVFQSRDQGIAQVDTVIKPIIEGAA